ncbi:MAG: AzlD domain-containing protein [Dehalococcoidia bacterium]|nr:AzlD domain-containing protein [Dehalococcoidia bacterium]
MNDTWLVVLFVGIATAAFKASGPVAIGGRELPPRLLRLVEALAPALLAALVATQAFATDGELVLDARALGLAAALVAIVFRAPVLVTIVVAAVVTALARA